jgi:hypothetical protein
MIGKRRTGSAERDRHAIRPLADHECTAPQPVMLASLAS